MEANKAQKDAIEHIDGPMLVLAGPGSGKTTVITNRVKHLVKEAGINPANILVITFTKAAATEMKERFYRLMEGENISYKYVTFGTFHAVFYMILKHAYNLSAENIIRDEERYSIIRRIINSRHMDVEDEKEFCSNILSEIATVKSERISPENFYSGNCSAELFREIYDLYDRELKRRKLLDFEDMLVYTYHLFMKRKDIMNAWRDKFRYILIDEFQDINRIQYDIIRMLSEGRKNLFIVGDDDQSIYGFRGSRPEIMLNFEKDFPGTKKIILDVNYRSTPQIVDAAVRVIRWNNKRFNKQIHAVRSDGPQVVVRKCSDFIDEYREVADLIKRFAADGTPYGNIAVLYRSNLGIGSLVRKLMEYNIPLRLKDKVPDIFEHWIAKDIFAYINLAMGCGNRSDFLQIVNRPKRYIGRDYLDRNQIDFDELCERYYKENKEYIAERIKKLESDLKMIAKLNPFAAVNYIRKAIGYDDYLIEYSKQRNISVDEIFDVVNEIMESTVGQNTFVQWFEAIKDYKKRLSEQGDGADLNKVTITTMHSSKGLEYDVVFVVDVNEGSCPHKKAIKETDIEEERRMLYVAMTRAKNNLFIYTTMNRFNKEIKPSRFLVEAGLVDDKKTLETVRVSDGSSVGSKTLKWKNIIRR